MVWFFSGKTSLMRLLAAKISARGVINDPELEAGNAPPVAQPADCPLCGQNFCSFIYTRCMHLAICENCVGRVIQEERGGEFACPVCQRPHTADQIKKVYIN
jgi:Zinc finger, C3HC4 type (RING finger)